MTIDPKLLEKIQKILNLADGSNEHESAAALEKAAKMMEEYNLTHRDLKRAQIAETLVKSTQSISKAKDWENFLMHMVSKVFGCGLVFHNGHSRDVDYWARWGFVGEKTNAQLAEYTATVLLRQLTQNRAKFSLKLSSYGFKRGKAFTAELDGYCKGYVRTMRSKVYAFAENSKELEELIQEFIDELCKGNKVKPQDRGAGRFGLEHGQKDAKDFSLTRPMDQEQRKRLA